MKTIQLYLITFQILQITCEYNSLKKFITEKYLKYTQEEVMISKCILRLIQHYTSHRRQLILILRDVDFDVSVISQSSTVKLHGDVNNEAQFRKMVGTNVVKSTANVETILKNSHWTAGTRFVVFLPRINTTDKFYVDDLKYQNLHFKGVISEQEIVADLRRDLLPRRNVKIRGLIENQVKNILKQFKDQRVMHAVVAVPQKKNIYFYTYIPFSEFNCADRTVVVLLNVWYSQRGSFFKDIRFFPDKVADFFGCPINVSLVSSPPGILKFSDGTVGGIEGGMISYIFEMINATPVFRFVDYEEANLNESVAAMNYVLNEIKNGISDMGAGLLVPSIAMAAETDDVNFCLTVCLTWAVPNQAKEKSAVAPIFETFKTLLWALILIVTIGAILTLWMFYRPTKANLSESAFKILTVFIGKSTTMPRGNPARIFIICFVWYSIILNTAFQAGLGSKHIIGYFPDQLATTEDVIESGFEMTGVDSTAHLFLNGENGTKVKIHPMDIQMALTKVAFERKTAYLGLRLAVRYYSRVVMSEMDVRENIYIQKECIVQYHPFLALRKNSPFTARVLQLVSRLVEGGFKDRLDKNFAAKIVKSEKKKKKRKKEHMYGARGALIILMFGLGASFILFLCEHVVHYLYRRNQI